MRKNKVECQYKCGKKCSNKNNHSKLCKFKRKDCYYLKLRDNKWNVKVEYQNIVKK